MKKYQAGIMALMGGALLFSGCAKHDMVKKDETIIPPVVAAVEPAREQPAKKLTATIAPVVKDIPVAPKQAISKMEQLQRALGTIYFEYDAATLSPAARSILSKNFDLLRSNPAVKVQIEGHCDERGSDAYNLALGERRSKSALQYLVIMGIKADRLSTISFGKEKPVANGHDEASWSKNRRDEFVVSE